MAVTQERTYAIVQAGQHYQALWRGLVLQLRKLRQGEISQEELDDWLREAQEETCHAETLIREEEHYKHSRHRNNWAKEKMAQRRAQARGEVVVDALPTRPYERKGTPPISRETSHKPPPTPNPATFDWEG